MKKRIAGKRCDWKRGQAFAPAWMLAHAWGKVLPLGLAAASPALALAAMTVAGGVCATACRADTVTSPLTGLELPAGAQRVQSKADLEEGRTLLEKLAHAGGKRIGRMEGYHWTQTEGVQARMDKTLAQASDLYKKLPDLEQKGVKVASFVAAFKPRKLACMGMWLQSASELYLVLGEALDANAAPPAKEAPAVPALAGDRGGAAASGNTGIVPPRQPGAATFPHLTRKPGVVQGTVLDSSGNPMPDATITAAFSLPSFFLVHPADVLKTATDAQGHYAINVKETAALGHIFAARRVQYNGMSYALPFMRLDAGGHLRNGDVINREEGDVVNFKAAISGLRESNADPEDFTSYFGGLIEVDTDTQTANHALPAGTRVRLALTPAGPLLDGSAGRPIVQDVLVTYTSINYKWKNIPIGRYFATATLLLPGGAATPLRATARVWVKGFVQVLPMNANTPLFFPPNGDNIGFIDLDISFP